MKNPGWRVKGGRNLELGTVLESSLGGQGHFWGSLRASTGAFWGQENCRHGKDPRIRKAVGGRNSSLSNGVRN